MDAIFSKAIPLETDLFTILIITTIFNIITSITATFGNSLILIVLNKRRDLQTRTYILLGFLSATDVIVGLIIQPLHVCNGVLLLMSKPNCELFDKMDIMSLLFIGWSLFTVAEIALTRYMAIFFPYKHNAVVTKKRICVCTLIVWAIWLVVIVLYAEKIVDFIFMRYFFSILILLILLTTSIICVKIYKLVKEIKRQVGIQSKLSTKTRTLIKQTKLTKTLAVITTAFALCFLPTMCLLFIHAVVKFNYIISFKLWPVFDLVLLLNSTFNPIIYSWRCRDMRKAILRYVKTYRMLNRKASSRDSTWSLSRVGTGRLASAYARSSYELKNMNNPVPSENNESQVYRPFDSLNNLETI